MNCWWIVDDCWFEWLASPPLLCWLHSARHTPQRAAQGRSKLHFFSSPIRKNELKRNECFADGRLQRNQTVPFLQLLISLSFHYHSMKFHQLLKYFHCLIPLITVIILFFNSIPFNSRIKWNEIKEKKVYFLLFDEWNDELNWLFIASFIEEFHSSNYGVMGYRFPAQ